MAKVKVKRKADDGSEQELELEEAEVLETDERVPEAAPGKPKPEKSLPQAEVNKLMADERRKHKAELDALRAEYGEFKKTVEDREKAAQDAAAEKVEALRKDLPESISKLLDKLTPVEQLEWLSDPANKVVKQEIPPLPNPEHQPGQGPRVVTII
jgi:hypothetical protein